MNSRNQAIDFLNQGVTAAKSDPNLAYRMICSAVMVDPTFSEGWNQVGSANAEAKWLDAAVAAFRRGLENPDGDQPGDLNPIARAKMLTNLGHRLFHTGRLKEARAAIMQAIETDPDPVYAWLNLSLIQSVDGELDESLASAKKAFAMSPEPVCETGLAFAYLHKKDWANGLKHFEARYSYKLPQYLSYPYPQWRGEDLTGKKIFVVAEQGMGDTISFSRFLPEMARRAERVSLFVQPEILRLFRQMFGQYRNIDIGPIPTPFPEADYWCGMTSLPVALNYTSEQIATTPGVSVPWTGLPLERAQWKIPGRRLHIGIAWAGTPGNEIDKWRRIPVTQFLELYRVPGIQLYSFQKGGPEKELHDAGCGTLIHDLSPYIMDATDTIEIMRQLDLIITVESSPGHMAGAIGAETWIPYSFNGGDFRIGRDESGALWYPKHRIFRQGPEATWGPVFERIIEALRERIGP